MSTAGPGIRLAGRYRLEDRVGAGRGWSAWKAIDEALARPVTVSTLAPGFPRIAEAMTAARQAGRLSDARLAQVFDVDTARDHAYVVTEWVAGDTLDDLLAYGPLDPGRGAEIITQGAEALAIAHAAGVPHLCLTPRSLRWTADGGVKIVGLGIDAALVGVTADDQALADTQGLGRLLYAALTASWPGGGMAVPAARARDQRAPAPAAAGARRRARRDRRRRLPGAVPVRCGRPSGIHAGHAGDGAAPGQATACLAATTHHRSAEFRRVAGAPRGGPAVPYRRGARIAPPGSPERETVQGRRPVAARMTASIAVVLASVAIGVGVWSAGHRGQSPRAGDAPQHRSSPPPPPVRVLKPLSAGGFDPLSSVANDPGNENTGQARFVIDGDPATAWHTQYYLGNPRFGGLKSGTGLILDMGRPVRLSSVTVSFGAVPGANVAIEVGNSDTRSAAALGTFTTVSRKADVGGAVTFRGTAQPPGGTC